MVQQTNLYLPTISKSWDDLLQYTAWNRRSHWQQASTLCSVSSCMNINSSKSKSRDDLWLFCLWGPACDEQAGRGDGRRPLFGTTAILFLYVGIVCSVIDTVVAQGSQTIFQVAGAYPSASMVEKRRAKTSQGIGLDDDAGARRRFPLLGIGSSILFEPVLVIRGRRGCHFKGRQVGDGENSQARCDAT